MARRPDARSPFPQKEPSSYRDPTYEGIRAPKFYNFCQSEDEDGRHSGDSWFERNNGEFVTLDRTTCHACHNRRGSLMTFYRPTPEATGQKRNGQLTYLMTLLAARAALGLEPVGRHG